MSEQPPKKPLFSFKPVSKPLKESSLKEGQAISIAPPDSEVRLIAMIKQLSPEQIWLELPRPIPGCAFKKGDKFKLKLWDYYESAYCDSEVMEVTGADQLVVSRPTEGEMLERKRSWVVYDKILFSLTVKEAQDEAVAGRTVDDLQACTLTLDGLECTTDLALERGDKVEVTLHLPPDQEFTTAAEVIASHPEEQDDRTVHAFNVRFVDMDAERYNQLALFLALTMPAGTVEDIFWSG